MTDQKPRMMTVREIARTGLMSEHALRLLLKAGKLRLTKELAESSLRLKLKPHPENQLPVRSRRTKDSGAKRAWAVSAKSTRTSGKGAILPSGRTAKNTPATSMLTARRNAKNC